MIIAQGTACDLYRKLFEQSPTATAVYDLSMRIVECNRAMASRLGSTRDRLIGSSIDDVTHQPHQPHRDSLERALAGEVVRCESSYLYAPLRDGLNAVTAALVLATGCEHEARKQRDLEEQLRRAQRMEPVALLAGGVAHDFNNLLTIVQVSSDFLARGLGEAASLHPYVGEIQRATRQAACLTRQLLTFSRKQILHRNLI